MVTETDSLTEIVSNYLRPQVAIYRPMSEPGYRMRVVWGDAHIVTDITPVMQFAKEKGFVPSDALKKMAGTAIVQLAKHIAENGSAYFPKAQGEGATP